MATRVATVRGYVPENHTIEALAAHWRRHRHVSRSFESIRVLPDDSSPVEPEPGAIVRTRPTLAEPGGADFTTARRYRHHDLVSPAISKRSQGVGRLGSLRPGVALGSKYQHYNRVQRSGSNRRQAARQGNIRSAYDPKRR